MLCAVLMLTNVAFPPSPYYFPSSSPSFLLPLLPSSSPFKIFAKGAEAVGKLQRRIEERAVDVDRVQEELDGEKVKAADKMAAALGPTSAAKARYEFIFKWFIWLVYIDYMDYFRRE